HMKMIRAIIGILISPLLALQSYQIISSFFKGHFHFHLLKMEFAVPTALSWFIAPMITIMLAAYILFISLLIPLRKRLNISSILPFSALGSVIASSILIPAYISTGNFGNLISSSSTGFLLSFFYYVISIEEKKIFVHKKESIINYTACFLIVVLLVAAQEIKYETGIFEEKIVGIGQTQHISCSSEPNSEFCINRPWNLYFAKKESAQRMSLTFNKSQNCSIGGIAILSKNGTLVNRRNQDYMSYKLIGCKGA